MIRDCFGKTVWPYDIVAISTTSGIRVGIVTQINTYPSDDETEYTITIQRRLKEGTKKQTFPYSQENLFLVKP